MDQGDDAAPARRFGARAPEPAAAETGEELRVMVEELQTANEALLASREELRAINAEMQAINAELADQLAALATRHENGARLLEALGLAVVVLDNGGRLRQFTERARSLFLLADADIARPVAALGMRLPYGDFEHDHAELRHARAPLPDRRRLIASGRECLVRTRPLIDADGVMSGTVFVFLESD